MHRKISPQTRRVVRLSLPIFAELLLQMLVGNMDQLMIAPFGQAAVTAIGNGNQVINVVIIFFTTTSTATTILLTRRIGAGQRGRPCHELCSVGVGVTAAFSLGVGAALLLGPEWMFRALKTPQEAFAQAVLYTRIVGGTVLLQGLYAELCAILRSYALLREVVVVSTAMNLLNVAGNAVLINGLLGLPRLGVIGAAVSTVLSKAVGVALVWWMVRRRCAVELSWRYLRPFPRETMGQLVGIVLPSGAEALSYNVSQIFILRFINVLGTAAVTAKVYGGMLANVAYVYVLAVSQATQILLGYMIGARKLEQVEGRVWSTLRISLVVSEVLTLLLLVFSDPLYGIFTPDSEVHALGRQVLMAELLLELGRSVNIVMTRCLTTAGDVWYPVGIGVFSMWLVAVGGAWLFGQVLGGGLLGIWLAMAADECLRGVLFLRRFRQGQWREKSLLAAPPPSGGDGEPLELLALQQ